MKYYGKHLLLVVFILSGPGIFAQQKSYSPEIKANEIQETINYLASDQLEGRMTGSNGAALAAEFIRKDFQKINLQPLFDGKFMQMYPFISSLKLTKNNSLEFTVNNFDIKPKIESEFVTVPFSGKAEVNSDLVFAGYGISAPDLKYDDYDGIDVKGKTVVILRYNPEGDNPHSDFGKFSAYRYKAKVAREKGAAAVIFVTGFYPKDDVDKLMPLKYDGAKG